MVGVCARSNGRLVSEAQPATCNATKQVRDEEEEEGKKKGEERKAHDVCVCESPPSTSSLAVAWTGLVKRRRECVFTRCGCGGFYLPLPFTVFTIEFVPTNIYARITKYRTEIHLFSFFNEVVSGV